MKVRSFCRIICALLIIFFSSVVIIWVSLPPESVTDVIPMRINGEWIEPCTIQVEWTPLVFTGVWPKIDLNVGAEDPSKCGESLFELYKEYNLMIEARLQFLGVPISPLGDLNMALLPRQGAQYSWEIQNDKAGVYNGTMWVFLNLVPKENGEEKQYPLIAREIMIESRSIAGLPVSVIRLAGIFGILIGGYLILYLEK